MISNAKIVSSNKKIAKQQQQDSAATIATSFLFGLVVVVCSLNAADVAFNTTFV